MRAEKIMNRIQDTGNSLTQGKRGPSVRMQNSLWSLPILQSFFAEAPSFFETLHQDIRSGKTLKQAVSALSSATQQELRTQVGAGHLSDLLSLSQKKHGPHFWKSVVNFGIKLKSATTQKEIMAASQILGWVAQGGQGIPGDIRQRAQEELNTLYGAGSAGKQVQTLMGGFLHQAFDWRFITPMVFASTVNFLAKGFTASRLAASTTRTWYNSGLGARVLPTMAGFGSEVGFFTLGTRGLMDLTEGGVSWDPKSVSKDMLSTGLTLGAMHGMGALGRHGFLRYKKINPAKPPLLNSSLGRQQWTLGQTTGYLGLVSAHKLEEELGLRDPGANIWLSSLATHMSLQLGSHLGRGMLGPWFSRLNQHLAMRANSIGYGPELAAAGVGAVRNDVVEPQPAKSHNSYMSGSGENGNGNGAKHLKLVPDSPRDSDPAEPVGNDSPSPIRTGTRFVDGGDMDSIPDRGSDPLIGTVIGDRIRVERFLGEGAMGLVYQGRHVHLDKKVAVKVLKLGLPRQDEMNKRFSREAQAVSDIGNQHIIKIHDFGHLHRGPSYFIMEFLEGQPLSEAIKGGEPMALSRLLHVASQLTDGMEAAHQAGIVHRDLKPENLFLTKSGKDKDFLKILDFGIVQVASGEELTKLTMQGEIFGTPHYMSPEQAIGKPVDHRADIYGMGVILYELVSGRRPFEGDNPLSILQKHISQTPIPPRRLVADPNTIPPHLEAIILKCLHKNPDDRYQSMRELQVDLDRLDQGLPPEVMKKNMKMPPWQVLAGISGAILAAGGIGVALYSSDDPEEESSMDPSATTSSAQPTGEIPKAPVSTATQVQDLPPVHIVHLVVKTKGARVFVDGEDRGTGKIMLEIDKGSEVEVKIKKRGYQTRTLMIDDSKKTVEVKLKPIVWRVPVKPRTPHPPVSTKKPPKKKDKGVISPW